jgi:hypothetical protein
MTATTGTTMRQQFLDAANDIKTVCEAHSETLGYHGRQDIRDAYRVLIELGTHIPDIPAGSPLEYGGMADKDVAEAVKQAEKGYASPAAVLELTREMRRLRAELHALGGPYGVTESDIRSVVAEGFHTALRKRADSMEAAIAWKAIRDMDSGEYAGMCQAVAGPVISMLRAAEARAAELQQGQEGPS